MTTIILKWQEERKKEEDFKEFLASDNELSKILVELKYEKYPASRCSKKPAS